MTSSVMILVETLVVVVVMFMLADDKSVMVSGTTDTEVVVGAAVRVTVAVETSTTVAVQTKVLDAVELTSGIVRVGVGAKEDWTGGMNVRVTDSGTDAGCAC